MTSRPYLATGATLASAALIATAAPVLLPAEHAAKLAAMAPVPARMSTAPYELAAVTVDDLIDAYYNGYGAQVTDSTTVSGLSGVLYYLIDTQLASSTDLDNYFFEVSPGYAVEQALYETFGTDSAVGQAVNLIWNPQTVVSSAIIDTASSVFGTDSVVYNAVNYYFNGYEDSSTGVPSVVHYLLDTITAGASSAASTTASATATTATSATEAAATTAATEAAPTTAATEATSTTTAVATTEATATAATADKTESTISTAAAATTETASAAVADTTATSPATESTTAQSPLTQLSKKFSPTLKSDSTTSSYKAVSDVLKSHPGQAGTKSATESRSGGASSHAGPTA